MITSHTDHVGSLLRPPELLRAREDLGAGKLTASDFKKIEDRAVDEAVALQEEVGLDVVTDGEMRRLSFQSQMTAAVQGFAEHDIDAFLWGKWHSEELGDWSVDRPASIGIVSRLKRRRYLSADEFTYLRGRTTRTPKVTLPSPTLFTNFWSERSTEIYSTLDAFLADVVTILREEVAELVRLGATYIQLDAPHYTQLLDERTRRFYEERGGNLESWLGRGVELENRVMDGFPDVTFGFHL
jgi:5-methyltetrahydropteroyltriglutamate--homocysteine methyltransferase